MDFFRRNGADQRDTDVVCEWFCEQKSAVKTEHDAKRSGSVRPGPCQNVRGGAIYPGEHQQQILPVDRVASVRSGFAPNLNRYLTRSIDMDLCQGRNTLFTYAKPGRFIVLGFMAEPEPNRWRGTKVNANQGTTEPKSYVLPAAFGECVNDKAKRMAGLLESMSDQQHKKVDEAFRKNIDKFVGSDAYDAMRADVEMFGSSAFSKRGQGSK